MNSSQLLFEIPKRNSLAAQAADSIQKAIVDGTWLEFLPSEASIFVARPLPFVAESGRRLHRSAYLWRRHYPTPSAG